MTNKTRPIEFLYNITPSQDPTSQVSIHIELPNLAPIRQCKSQKPSDEMQELIVDPVAELAEPL